MRQAYITVMVFPGEVARIASSSNLDAYFRKAAQRHGAFIPVAAFPMSSPKLFMEAFSIERLPFDAELDWAADKLFRAPVDIRALPAVIRHIRRLGDKAVPLLEDWHRAVMDAQIAA